MPVGTYEKVVLTMMIEVGPVPEGACYQALSEGVEKVCKTLGAIDGVVFATSVLSHGLKVTTLPLMVFGAIPTLR